MMRPSRAAASAPRPHGSAACAAPSHALASRVATHLYIIVLVAALVAVAATFKINSFLDHRRHAGEELERAARLWERNCKLAHSRVDAEGKLNCDELYCFVSKSAQRVALGRTLAELDVIGRLLSPAMWQYVTTNLGAAFFVLALVYMALSFGGQLLAMRMREARDRRRLAEAGLPLAYDGSGGYGSPYKGGAGSGGKED